MDIKPSIGNKNLIMVTGVAGSGKSLVLETFSKLGYLVIENLEPSTSSDAIKFLTQNYKDIAFSLKKTDQEQEILQSLESLKKLDLKPEILFLTSSKKILIKRYKETRRAHSHNELGLLEAINKDAQSLAYLTNVAHRIVDTSDHTRETLAAYINSLYDVEHKNKMVVHILSFGYKHGVPLDADLMFDMRFIPNPFYIDELRLLTGEDHQVYQYVMEREETKEFKELWLSLVKIMLNNYLKTNRAQLTIAIGCTGGEHRSVAMSRCLYDYLTDHFNQIKFILDHRDISINQQKQVFVIGKET